MQIDLKQIQRVSSFSSLLLLLPWKEQTLQLKWHWQGYSEWKGSSTPVGSYHIITQGFLISAVSQLHWTCHLGRKPQMLSFHIQKPRCFLVIISCLLFHLFLSLCRSCFQQACCCRLIRFSEIKNPQDKTNIRHFFFQLSIREMWISRFCQYVESRERLLGWGDLRGQGQDDQGKNKASCDSYGIVAQQSVITL